MGFRGAILRHLGLRQQSKSFFPPWLNPDLVSDLGLHERWKRARDQNNQSTRNGAGPTNRPEAFRDISDPAWPRIFESYDAGVTKIPLDVRHPLFDIRLVNYCLGVPPIPWFVDKTLARVAMLNRLPDTIRLRAKSFAADTVAVRLPQSSWVDGWSPVPELSPFVDRSRIPVLATAGASWDPHHRPFALNQWLSQLTSDAG